MRYVLDTDTLSLYQWGHPIVTQRVSSQPATDLAVTVITVQEQMDGWRAALARANTPAALADWYARLAHALLPSWAQFTVLPFPEPAILRFQQPVAMRLNVA